MENQRQPFNYGKEFISAKLEDLVGFLILFNEVQPGSPNRILQSDLQAERSGNHPTCPRGWRWQPEAAVSR